MKSTIKIGLQLLIALVGIFLLGLSISGRVQSTWPLCGALGCLIASNVINILRMKKQREKENGSDKNR